LNRALLGITLAQLEAAGFAQVAVNTHHLADMVHDFLAKKGPWGLNLQVSNEPEVLGTGGGLKRLGEILGAETFLAVNGDILTDLDLGLLYRRHREGAVATLVLHDCPPHNHVWVEGGLVVGIGAPPGGAAGPPLAYTGIQVVARGMLEFLPPGRPYDLVAAWREALAAGARLAALVVSGHFWEDLGTPEGYLAAHRRLLSGAVPALAPFFPNLADPLIGPGATLGPGVELAGGVCLGAGVRVGARAFLSGTVVWDGAEIAPDVRLEDCIVGLRAQVLHSASNQILI
jgi:mannose-1-phosphate guanylyltransferase